MAGRFAFLPNARNTLVNASQAPAAGGNRRRIALDVEITADGIAQLPRVPAAADLVGPGDVTGVSRAMISRIEPAGALRAFEPNYIPFLEFIDADFPWRYSLELPLDGRIKPWVVLIALAPEEFEVVTGAAEVLPRIRVANPSIALPDLAQSWAYAHVQLALPDAATTVSGSLSADATRSFSRLFCPRRLEERRAYTLFLVPAFEAGRQRGLGTEPTAQPFDAPAWSTASADPVDLPVYYQSRFVTDSLEDLETMLRRLKPMTIAESAAAGTPTRASAARPGYYPGYTNPGHSFEVQGALQQVNTPLPVLDTDAALNALMAETLKNSIKGEAGIVAAGEPDPPVAFPAYGWRYGQESEVSRPKAEQREWFDLVNLDLKFRQAAGRGAETVRRNQEVFAQRCFEQYEEIVEANRRLARLNFAAIMAERMTVKHLAKLAPDTVLALAEPLQPYVKGTTGKTIIEELRAAGAPTSYAARGLRKLSAKRMQKMDVAGVGRLTVAPQPAIPGDQTSNNVLLRMQRHAGDRDLPPLAARIGLTDEVSRRVQGFLDVRMFQQSARPAQTGIRVARFESRGMATHLTDTVKRLPAAKALATIGGLRPVEQQVIAPVYRAPVVTEPLVDKLNEFATDAILTDATRIPTDRVALFEENRSFIEAFLVGANHEMNKELRWREFPTDMRGTIFKRFWNRHRADSDPKGDDIAAIHGWTRELGKNFPPTDADQAGNLVLVIHSDLVAKYEMPIVNLNIATGSVWQSASGVDHEPVFSGKVTRDIAYYGYDVSRELILGELLARTFLVIYEPPGRMRFGLDIATASVRQSRQNIQQQSLAFPVRHLLRTEAKVLTRPDPPAAVPIHPAKWDDFSWSHVARHPSGYINFDTAISIPNQPDYWGAGKTSASVARSFWQKPIAAVLPLRRVVL